MELQKLLSTDTDKLTFQKDKEYAENIIRQLTEQLKKLKQEAHFKTLELQKKSSELQDAEFAQKKLRKDNEFLMKKLESLDNAHQELLAKTAGGDESRSSIAFGNELAELEGEDAAQSKDDRIDELQEELTASLA